MTIEQYQKINDQYRKTLIFHFGSGAGFFSEYNNMLRVIVYCLVHRIKFVMYSADAQFAMGKGWCDYFMPFCPETDDIIHHKYNKRFTDNRITTNFGFFVKCLILTILRFTKKYYRHYYKFYESFKIKRIKKNIGFNYFTYDLWYDVINMSDDSVVSIDGVGKDSVKNYICLIDSMIWKYNETTKIEKERLISQIGVNHFDCGMQIRGGDKFLEAKIIKPIKYMRTMDALKLNCKKVFVLTDDIEVIESLRKERKDLLLYSFCTNDQHGYYNNEFYKKNKEDIYRQMVRLLVSVDILSDCDIFIGTISANPSKCVYIKKQGENFISLD